MNTRVMLETTWRRRHWLFARLRLGQLWNYAIGGLYFAAKRERVASLPGVVKIGPSACRRRRSWRGRDAP